MIALVRNQLALEAEQLGSEVYDPYKYTNEHYDTLYKVFVEDKGLHI